MVNRRSLVAVLLFAVVGAGCASGEFRGETGATVYPPYQGSVELLEKFPPKGTYDRLGIITVEVNGVSYEDTLTDRMKKEAAARGANAVVLQGKERSGRDGAGHLTGILAGWAIRRK